MSVLMKGMKMPPSCRYCEFRHLSLTQNAFCTAAQETIDYMAERTKRLDNCPLILIPPHGRLIDADALHEELYALEYARENEWLDGVREARGVDAARVALLDAPTIIEAEEGE